MLSKNSGASFLQAIAILGLSIATNSAIGQTANASTEAQGCTSTYNPTPDNWSTQLVSAIFSHLDTNTFFDTFVLAGTTMGQKLTTAALALAGSLMLLSLAWTVVKGMVLQTEVMGAVVIETAIGILTVVMINNYAAMTGILSGIEATTISVFGSNPSKAMGQLFVTIISNLIQGFAANGNTLSCYSILHEGIVSLIFQILFSTILYLVSFVFLLISVIELLTVMVIGPVIAGIGLAFGPLLIASLVTPWTRPMFTTWVKFVLSGMMLYVVVTVVLTLLNEAFLQLAQTWFGPANNNILGTVLGMSVLMVCMGKIFSALPAISGSLWGTIGAHAANLTGKGFASSLADGGSRGILAGGSAVAGSSAIASGAKSAAGGGTAAEVSAAAASAWQKEMASARAVASRFSSIAKGLRK